MKTAKVIQFRKPYVCFPIGQRVQAVREIRVPTYFNTLGENVRLDVGTVTAHLPLGGFIVEFDKCPEAWEFQNSGVECFVAID